MGKCRNYFITICTFNRAKILCDVKDGHCILSKFGQCVEKYLRQIPNKYAHVTIDRYVIMPNHIHMIVGVGASHEPSPFWTYGIRKGLDEARNTVDHHECNMHAGRDPHLQRGQDLLLSQSIGYLKMNSAKQINQIRKMPGYSVWQRNYYEHVIRNKESLEKIGTYI